MHVKQRAIINTITTNDSFRLKLLARVDKQICFACSPSPLYPGPWRCPRCPRGYLQEQRSRHLRKKLTHKKQPDTLQDGVHPDTLTAPDNKLNYYFAGFYFKSRSTSSNKTRKERSDSGCIVSHRIRVTSTLQMKKKNIIKTTTIQKQAANQS